LARMDSRNARRMMQRMGMQMNEVGNVTRVIIQSPGKEIVIEQPTVTSINVQGQKMYQVLGGKVVERVPQATATASPQVALAPPTVYVPEEDVLLVSQQAKVSMEVARKALVEADGDLAKAILKLQTR
jgi:nascent polypeptide-associated complex subunit alpha